MSRSLLPLLFAATALAQQPDVKQIIEKSVQANHRDFQAAPHWICKERDIKGGVSTTYLDLMIDGSPYQQVIEINGQPVSAERQKQEQQKLEEIKQKRAAESSSERQKRIAKFDADRGRDNEMMDQLTAAFTFRLLGTRTLNGRTVWDLKAIPKPDYKPINLSTQVLPGMTGELWIDQKTYQWVKVTARVIHPVSIAGFLARVEPGTRFELEKAPVGDGSVWMASHFSMRSNARVLGMFNHNSAEDDTFWDYKPE